MADFMEGTYEPLNYDFSNRFEQYSGPLAPQVIHWDETASVTGAGRMLSGEP